MNVLHGHVALNTGDLLTSKGYCIAAVEVLGSIGSATCLPIGLYYFPKAITNGLAPGGEIIVITSFLGFLMGLIGILSFVVYRSRFILTIGMIFVIACGISYIIPYFIYVTYYFFWLLGWLAIVFGIATIISVTISKKFNGDNIYLSKKQS